MDNNNAGLSVADVAALNNGGLGNFEGLIYLAVIASMFGNGGWFGNGANGATDAMLAASLANQNTPSIGYENLATASEVQRGFDNQNNVSNQREILAAVNAGTAQSVAAVNQSYHDIVGALGDRYSELQRDIAANAVSLQQVMANQNECCGSTKSLIQGTAADIGAAIAQSRYDTALGFAGINAGIAQNRYEAAMNTAAINENTTAQTQRILDAITGNRMADMQNQINSLELQNALAGVLKYPMATTYGVPSPCFCGGGCCGNI